MIQPSLSFVEGIRSTMLMEHDDAPWLALARVKGLGCVSFKKLAACFGDPTQAFSATPSELAAVDGLQRDAIEGLVGFSQWAEVNTSSSAFAVPALHCYATSMPSIRSGSVPSPTHRQSYTSKER
jgi:hypothetical protein